MMMDVSFVWPTFHNDGACCVESVKQVLALGVDPKRCHVGEHVGKELRQPEREALEALGVRLRPSRFRRSQTYPEIVNILQLMLDAAGDGDAEWVFQLDSDTMLCRLGPIDEAITAGKLAMATTWPKCGFAGCAWLCRTDVLKVLRKDFSESNTMKIPHATSSDTPVGLLLDHLYGAEAVRRHQWNSGGGYCKGWQYGRETMTLETCAQRWDAVTFGNRAQVPAAGRPIRDVIAETMAEFRAAIAASEPKK